MTTATTTRNAGLEDLVTMLRDQHARKIDLVLPARSIHTEGGNLVINGLEGILTEDGVLNPNGHYTPTKVCDEGISEKLRIPLAYLRRMREDHPHLYDANVNGWLHGTPGNRAVIDHETGRIDYEHGERPGAMPDQRKFLVRGFRGEGGGPGIARAFLSDSYSIMDNLDVLMATLDGVRAAGVDTEITGCDLTERRMYVKISAPQVQALAPTMLADYRSPFTGARGADNPVVFAGFQVSNSEVGGGAFTIVPRLTVLVCNNGMTVTKDAMRAVHLGSRLDEGIVSWSRDTQEKNLALVTAKARDAVASFLSQDYLNQAVAKMEAKAGVPIEHLDEVTVITKDLRYTEEQQGLILEHFSKAGAWTRGGVAGAITSAAQVIEDADVAAEMESHALAVLS